MITVTAPGFLLAGGLLAVIPILLHLLSRRPPDRVALPTARFLSDDPRTLLRLRRTPTDRPLLAVRVLFALTLSAAFAGLRWAPERAGSREVILVDAGADSLVQWANVVNAVEDAASRGGLGGEAGPSTSPMDADSPGEQADEPPLVVVYGLDGGPRGVTVDEVRELRRGSAPATLEDGLRALLREAATSRFAQARVTWVGRPSWRIWSPAVGFMRPALWPGRLRLQAVERDDIGASPDQTASAPATAALPTARSGPDLARPPQARIAVDEGSGALTRAVEALGGHVLPPSSGPAPSAADGSPDNPIDGAPSNPAASPPGSPPDWIVAEATPEGLAAWAPQVRAGAILVLFGEPFGQPPTNDASELPWSVAPPQTRPPEAGLLVLDGDRTVGGVVSRVGGRPAQGARTLLTFDDGTPAAAAREVGQGCVVFVAAALDDPALTFSPRYPELIRTLLLRCRETHFGDAPLDRGATQALERADLPAVVEVAAILPPQGRALTRWLLLAALGLLGLEVLLTRSRGRGSTRAAHPHGGGTP